MKRLLFFIWAIVLSFAAVAQQGNIWVFGDHAGLNFNSGSPVPIATNIYTIEGSASVCNNAGQLLFYTEGSTIWDRAGNPTPNGTNITGLILPGFSPTASTTQSSLIVPVPDSPGKYFVFSLTDGTILQKHNLYYSVVDMSLNGGLGDIVPGRKGILIDSMLSEKLTGTLGKCCNVWVVVNKSDGHFHAFEITAAGLNTTPVISNSGINNGFSYNFGEIKFSPDGNHMAAASQSFFGLKLYDFNGYTGMFSNIRTLRNKDFYGVCFSPDNTKLYAATDSLYQYDIMLPTLTAIVGSEKKVAKTGGLTNVKSGPDGKLYFAGFSGISAVQFPNISGLGCGVQNSVVSLIPGTYCVFGGLSNEVPVLIRDTAIFVRRDTTVCFRDSIGLPVPAPGCDYLWDNGSTADVRTVYANGNYVVYYHTPPCVFHADTFAVHFASRVPVTGSYSGCGQNGSAYLYINPGTGDTFPYTYTWHDSSGNQLQQHISATGDTLFHITPGRYSVSMGGNGCDTTILLLLTPPQQVKLSFTTDTVICIGDTSFLNNTSAGFNNYLWLFGDGNSSTVKSPQHLYAQPGIYTVTLIGYPCADTLRKTITVDSNSYIRFVTDKDHYCVGEGVICYPSYPPGASLLTWDFGDGTTGPGFQPKHGYDNPGTYVIHVRAQFRACADTSASDTVALHPYPVVNIGADTFMCPGGSPLQLQNLAQQTANNHHLWNTGDTTTGITAFQPGIYFLTEENEYGCAVTDSMEIRNSCYLDIPNVFTPNNDGLNDYFFPRELLSHALESFHMQVFDRWGEKIFETSAIDGRGWDGKYGGRAMPQGVYVYLVEAVFTNGIPEKHKGNVTLLR